MMGGILVATVLTILVLPATYALFFGKQIAEGDALYTDSVDDTGDRAVPAPVPITAD
jgi:hypothetical protein